MNVFILLNLTIDNQLDLQVTDDRCLLTSAIMILPKTKKLVNQTYKSKWVNESVSQ